MAAHLIYGIPVTLILFLTLFAVLRRTERLYAEIDRRSAAEDALRQSQKLEAIGHLTGGVAHDFNNLLTIIIGNLDNRAAPGGNRGPRAARSSSARRLENAMRGAQRAATLTKRLLAFARQQPLNPTALDVNRVLNGLSDFLRRVLGEDVSLEIVGGGGALAGRGRFRRAGGGRAQSRGQRPRRHAGRRQADHRGQQLISGRSLLPAERRCPPRSVCADRGDRHRVGHEQGSDRARVRAILHDQTVRPGHRARPEPSLWFRQAVRRAYQNLQRDRRRHLHQDLPAAVPWKVACRCAGSPRRAEAADGPANACWWSRTTPMSAAMLSKHLARSVTTYSKQPTARTRCVSCVNTSPCACC